MIERWHSTVLQRMIEITALNCIAIFFIAASTYAAESPSEKFSSAILPALGLTIGMGLYWATTILTISILSKNEQHREVLYRVESTICILLTVFLTGRILSFSLGWYKLTTLLPLATIAIIYMLFKAGMKHLDKTKENAKDQDGIEISWKDEHCPVTVDIYARRSRELVIINLVPLGLGFVIFASFIQFFSTDPTTGYGYPIILIMLSLAQLTFSAMSLDMEQKLRNDPRYFGFRFFEVTAYLMMGIGGTLILATRESFGPKLASWLVAMWLCTNLAACICGRKWRNYVEIKLSESMKSFSHLTFKDGGSVGPAATGGVLAVPQKSQVWVKNRSGLGTVEIGITPHVPGH